jgi:hypothetical protein
MHVPEIIEVKDHLNELKKRNMVKDWELPYENLLTRRSAAIFFIQPANEGDAGLEKIWAELSKYPNFSQRLNEEKKLSQMKYRVTFSKEELDKNEGLANRKNEAVQN